MGAAMNRVLWALDAVALLLGVLMGVGVKLYLTVLCVALVNVMAAFAQKMVAVLVGFQQQHTANNVHASLCAATFPTKTASWRLTKGCCG